MSIQAPKHSVMNAILFARSGWRQNTLATHLQHLLQKVTVFAEAQLRARFFYEHFPSRRGTWRHEPVTPPVPRLPWGLLLFWTCLCTLATPDNLTGKSPKPGQSRGVRIPLNVHCRGNQTVLEVVPELNLVSVAQYGNVPLCWNHLVCSRFERGGSACAGHSKLLQGPCCVNRRRLPIVAIHPYGQQMPCRANRAPVSSSRSSSCSGVAASLFPPCAVRCPKSDTFGCSHARPNGMWLICTEWEWLIFFQVRIGQVGLLRSVRNVATLTLSGAWQIKYHFSGIQMGHLRTMHFQY